VDPLIWFQPSGSVEARQCWHLDVSVAPAQVHSRVDGALSADGTLIRRDAGAQLSDPDGNKVCLTPRKDAPKRPRPNSLGPELAISSRQL
jgi:Glyoxalase-like domain